MNYFDNDVSFALIEAIVLTSLLLGSDEESSNGSKGKKRISKIWKRHSFETVFKKVDRFYFACKGLHLDDYFKRQFHKLKAGHNAIAEAVAAK